MTVINGVETDDIVIHNSNTSIDNQQKILSNEPIEEKLNIIAVISNPCLYKRRYRLFREFLERMEKRESNINLFVVELVYGTQDFMIAEKGNKNHLQLRTQTPLWHKENMINLAVRNLLPSEWKAFAWIDGDLEFENPYWVSDTLKLLNSDRDIIQLFSHAVDMDREENALSIFSSFGFQHSKHKTYNGQRGINYWHPGYAWAIKREAYERIGGLYEDGILGSGDWTMAMSIIKELPGKKELHEKMSTLKIGYVHGVIRHYYHGTKERRKYVERNDILYKHSYNPSFITRDEKGVIIPSDKMPEKMKEDIMNYFRERKEDE